MIADRLGDRKSAPKVKQARTKSARHIAVWPSASYGRRGILIAIILTMAIFGLVAIFRSKATTSSYAVIAPASFCPEATDYQRVKQLWPALKEQYKAWAPSIPSPSWGSSAGYVLPDYLLNPLEMAVGCSDIGMISDIADIYLQAANSGYYEPLTNTDGVTRRYWKGTDGEPDTSAAQWFGALSRTLAVIAATPVAQRTATMNQFVSTYKSTIAGFYKNRLYTATNWQGGGAAAFINTMYDNDYLKEDTYSPPAIGKYLYGLSQVYLAFKSDPSTVDLAGNDYPLSEATIIQTLKDGARLLKQRSTPTSLTNLQGQPVIGYNYDAGYWKNLEDNQYSEYDGPCYPILEAATMPLASNFASYLSNGQVSSCTTPGYRDPGPKNPQTSWDTAHMYIPIMFWRAMYTVQPLIGSDFPTYSDMQKYANQLAYGVSNKDPVNPRFKTYWSGSNGWLRLNYSTPLAPWQSSGAIMDNGLGGLLGGFNSDLRDMSRRIRDIMNSTTAADQALTKFNYSVKATDKGTANSSSFSILEPYFRNYENPESYYWFLFLSSVPPASFVAPGLGGTTPTPTSTPTPSPTITPTPIAQIVPPVGVGCSRIEAETMAHSAEPSLSTISQPYSGTGYLHDFGRAGEYVDASYTATSAGTYKFTIRYAVGGGDASRDILIDNSPVATLALPASADWYTWATVTTGIINLMAGQHTIRFLSVGGPYANYDYLDVCLTAAAPTVLPTATPVPTPMPTPVPTATPTPACTKAGDVNCDTKINTFDLQVIFANYGKRTTLRSQGDLTGDGVVNIFDLSQVLQNWGR